MQAEIVTYVYIDKEVKLTGRIALPPTGSKNGHMIEIIPVSSNIEDKEYARWVQMKDLHIIKNIEDEEFE